LFGTDEDFTFIEKLTLEELQKGKVRGDEYRAFVVIFYWIYMKRR
jgi:hypothetical protein